VHQDGLVHISAMSRDFVEDPRDVVRPGDVVKVKVLDVDEPRKRISLTLRLDDEVPEGTTAGRPSGPQARSGGQERQGGARNAERGKAPERGKGPERGKAPERGGKGRGDRRPGQGGGRRDTGPGGAIADAFRRAGYSTDGRG
ncbi:MAG: protein Tex, partial [Actinomycetota bacterium]|nr:protein Tex [Actinomycetota bacterium]